MSMDIKYRLAQERTHCRLPSWRYPPTGCATRWTFKQNGSRSFFAAFIASAQRRNFYNVAHPVGRSKTRADRLFFVLKSGMFFSELIIYRKT